jgi:hypothetical protein
VDPLAIPSTLTFPGIISQSHDGRKDTVQLIQSLATTYISQENTIILLAVPMESDINNSMASALIGDSGANDRTIGVLTKPDRLQSSDRVDVWKSVLKGQNFRKGHGYFVVKQPGQAELKDRITHTEARALEDKYEHAFSHNIDFHGSQSLSNISANSTIGFSPPITGPPGSATSTSKTASAHALCSVICRTSWLNSFSK